MSCLVPPPTFRRSGGKTVHAASVKKALATFQPIFKPTSPILPSQGRFLWKDDDPGYAAASFQSFKWRRRRKNDLPAVLFAENSYGRPFSVSERWNRSWWTSCCPRATSWWSWMGSPESSAKTSPPRTLAVDRPLQKVHSNRLWLGLKKSWNKCPSKMIHIEVILPGAFDSNHTSYIKWWHQEIII